MTLRLVVQLMAALALVSCSTGSIAREPEPAPVVAPIYRLAPDDKVKITVYGETDLSGEYLVGSDGNVSMPLVGMVPAAGKTLAEFGDGLTQQLADKYLNKPRVSVDIAEYRPFYILGEVNRAGQFPYRVGLTVNAAVATAGGFTYRANHKTVAIKHAGEPGEKRYRLTADLQIMPGDTVRVLERFF